MLVGAARAEQTNPDVQSQAIVALCKVDGADALKSVLAGLARLEDHSRSRPEYETARSAFLTSARTANQPDLLIAEAARLDGSPSRWADAGLLAVSENAASSPEARQAAHAALEAGWKEPRRRVQIIEAVNSARHRPYKPQVLAALTDPDKLVTAAANRVAKDLKFLVKSAVVPSGPQLAKLPVEEVVDAAVKAKGDPALGEELYGRLNCVKCHTVRQGEPARGPFLGNIANTYKRKELAEAILLPSKTIAQGFTTNAFALDDGRTVTGFVVQEAADKVVIRNSEGEELVIPTSTIDERSKQTLSMMPEGLVKEITIPEFASLIDYLESLAKPAK
jgi:putative heme-binding domain-containing protein